MRLRKAFFSNVLLVLGILFLGGFAAFEINGAQIDPLVPAIAAFCIACTAVLDRVGAEEFE